MLLRFVQTWSKLRHVLTNSGKRERRAGSLMKVERSSSYNPISLRSPWQAASSKVSKLFACSIGISGKSSTSHPLSTRRRASRLGLRALPARIDPQCHCQHPLSCPLNDYLDGPSACPRGAGETAENRSAILHRTLKGMMADAKIAPNFPVFMVKHAHRNLRRGEHAG